MKPILDRVTVTGADDNTDPAVMMEISREFPFVEWGILMSKSNMGSPRYPSGDWLVDIEDVSMHMNLSAHLCGSVVRDLLGGNDNLWDGWEKAFKRAQLNFHGQTVYFHARLFTVAIAAERYQHLQWIFQIDDMKGDFYFRNSFEVAETKLDAVRLFDVSGGAGILPLLWPQRSKDDYVGYAGGLSPDNVAEQLNTIASTTDGPCWIDAETWLRSADGRVLDMEKVRAFLEAARPWVIDAAKD